MSRPETIEDLPESERFTPVVTVCSVGLLHIDGDALRGLAQIYDLLEGSTWLSAQAVDDDHVAYVRRRSPREMRETLSEAQCNWDWRQGLYERAAAGEVLDVWRRHHVDGHARAEGLDPIDWDALDAAKGGEAR